MWSPFSNFCNCGRQKAPWPSALLVARNALVGGSRGIRQAAATRQAVDCNFCSRCTFPLWKNWLQIEHEHSQQILLRVSRIHHPHPQQPKTVNSSSSAAFLWAAKSILIFRIVSIICDFCGKWSFKWGILIDTLGRGRVPIVLTRVCVVGQETCYFIGFTWNSSSRMGDPLSGIC